VIRHALAELRAHPWRAALSGVSLCIGVLAIVAISTVGAITRDVFIAAQEQRDGRAVLVGGEARTAALTPDAVRAALDAARPVKDAGGGAALTIQKGAWVGVPGGRSAGVPLRAQSMTMVAGDLERVRRIPLRMGRWFDSHADVPVELVLNDAAAVRWGVPGMRLDVWVSREETPVTAVVTGIVSDGSADPNVYANLTALLWANPHLVTKEDSVTVLVSHPRLAVDELAGVAVRIVAAAGGEIKRESLSRRDTVSYLLSQLESQQQAFTIVAVVALIIAAIGMLNIGLASIGERARELVIRRAVGATRTAILGQIVLAAVAVGLLATVAAVGLAVGAVQWWVPHQITPIAGQELAAAVAYPTVPWQSVFHGVLAATATTLVGSALPAIVAARLDVATALRD
jgi:FtsX-like permease family/MacB-like periplasmic core domain